MVVVVTHESNTASYFTEEGNLNYSNAYMCSDVAGPASNRSGDLFELSNRSNTTYFYYFPTTSTTGVRLAFERDYNYNCLLGGVTSSCIRSIMDLNSPNLCYVNLIRLTWENIASSY